VTCAPGTESGTVRGYWQPRGRRRHIEAPQLAIRLICRHDTNQGSLPGRKNRAAPGCGSGFRTPPRATPDAAIIP
jgi:hypothetical protein